MIQCECPFCKESLEMGDEFAGKTIRCGGCRNVFKAAPVPVPKPEAKPAPRPRRVEVRARPVPSAQVPKGKGGGLLFLIALILLVATASGVLFLLSKIAPPRSKTLAELAQEEGTSLQENARELPVPVPVKLGAGNQASLPAGASDGEDSTGDAEKSSEPGAVQVGLMEQDAPTAGTATCDTCDYTSPGGSNGVVNLSQDRIDELVKALERDAYKFTPRVGEVYFKLVKAQALDDLKAMGKVLPAKFLAWVDGDAQVRMTVYGVKPKPANVLLSLYALQLDAGESMVREYTQLALAASVLNEGKGREADLTPRKPMKLVIPPCPLSPVDTRDKKRTLDVNDHIINFLNEDYKSYHVFNTDKNPRHKKDAAVAAFHFSDVMPLGLSTNFAKPRGLIASDVIKDDVLKDHLMDYLRKKGTPLNIPHGGLESSATYTNFNIFHDAYVAKGLLPGCRDPHPLIAERLIYLVDNAAHMEMPLKKVPWPISIMLFENSLPLRESEEVLKEHSKRKRMLTYGDYVGPIAQTPVLLAARDLRPFPYSCKDRSWQAMVKNGGVCGTMAAIAAGTYSSLGIPAVTAGQPGHCALVRYNISGSHYRLDIEQSVTGGPANTGLHVGWPFGDGRSGSGAYVYRESIASAMNVGLEKYLESCMVYNILRLIPAAVRDQHGLDLLKSGLDINPYNIMLVDALAEVGTPAQVALVGKSFDVKQHHTGKTAGMTGVYEDKIKQVVIKRISSLPVDPADPKNAAIVCAYLKDVSFSFGEFNREGQAHAEEMALQYQLAAHGTKKFMEEMSSEVSAHFNSSKPRYPKLCQQMARRVQLVAAMITDETEKKGWLDRLSGKIAGREDYAATGRLQIDRDKDGKPENYETGLGQLTLSLPGGVTRKVHFVMQNGNIDGSTTFRDKVALKETKRNGKPIPVHDAPTMIRDETADVIADLAGAPRKKCTGLNAILNGDALKDPKEAKKAVEFLEKSDFEEDTLICRYGMAAEGPDKFLAKELEQYKLHVADSRRNEASCIKEAEMIALVAGLVRDEKKRSTWLARMQRIIKGREDYFAVFCLQDKDGYGHPVPKAERKLGPCKRAQFHDETVDVIAKLMEGTAGGAAEPSPEAGIPVATATEAPSNE